MNILEKLMQTLHRRTKSQLLVAGLTAALPLTGAFGQSAISPAAQPSTAAVPAAAGGGRGGSAPAEQWYVNKVDKVVYAAPNKPLWKLADLLKMHAGQNNWSQDILKDDLQYVTYNSGAPGTKFIPRLHNSTATVFVVMKGQVRFRVEGQGEVTATRGGIVNVLRDTIYSYDVEGSENALWININPLGVRTEFPATNSPPPAVPGTTITKVAFTHKPAAYTGDNKLYFNLFDAIDKCQPTGVVVNQEHLFINPLLGFVNPADYKCPGGARSGAASKAPFDPNTTFGHLHIGVREWWIVQAGAINGRFEKFGEFHAVEGDVLNAEQDMWHQMGLEAPSGPSVRTAISAYPISNMNNTAVGGN